MCLFIVPEFYKLKNVWTFILKLQKSHPILFIPNRKIYSIYGSFPNMIWNGGRVCVADEDISEDEIRETFELYTSYNVCLSLTMTNLVLEEKHLSDKYCNKILEIANTERYNTECIVAKDLMEEYIRSKFPNIKINKSI